MLIQLQSQATTTPKVRAAIQASAEPASALAPPAHPQTNGMVERFNGRIEDVLQSHRFHSGEDMETTLHRYMLLYNQ